MLLGNTTISGFNSIVEPVCGGVQPSLHEEGTKALTSSSSSSLLACPFRLARLSWFCLLSDETNDLKINQCRLSAPVA